MRALMLTFASAVSPLPVESSLREPLSHAKASAMRILPWSLILATLSLTACSGQTVGTGTSSGTSGSSGASGTSTGGATDPGTENGAPVTPPAGTAAPPAGPSAYDPLFDAPTTTTTTPGSISGLWAGSTHSGDVRLKVSSGSLLIAIRCGNSPAVGLEVTAQVTASAIRVLASKSAGPTAGCGVNVTPQTIPRCTPTSSSGAPGIGCFDVTGTTLSFEGIWLFSSGGSGPPSDFTKLSD